MAIEPSTPTSLPDILDPTLPLSDDPLAQGDDHIRLIKTVVKNAWAEYQTAALALDAAIDALELAVSGTTEIDAARLGGQLPAYYLNASNLSTGTLPVGRLSGTYNINISGNAATASTADTATTAVLASDSALFAGKTWAQFLAAMERPQYNSSIAAPKLVGTSDVLCASAAILSSALPLSTARMVAFNITFDVGGASGVQTFFFTVKTLVGSTSYSLHFDARVCNTGAKNSLGLVVRVPAGATYLDFYVRRLDGTNVYLSNFFLTCMVL